MFIKLVKTYYSKEDGEQRTGKGLFLILIQNKHLPTGRGNTRAIVRKVALRQLGHFMMGSTIIKGHTISLSGAYGNNGLVVDVPTEVYEMGVEIPDELYERWNNGGGGNSCGSEAPYFKTWALENIKQLTKRE